MKKLICLYIRVSTIHQENGMDSQRRSLEAFCESRGIKNFQIYEDFAISGGKFSRPALDKLLKDVESGVVEEIIVFSVSRLGRSLSGLLQVLEFLNSHSVKLTSKSENFDLSSAWGKTLYQILGVFAELEKSLVRERTIAGLKAAVKRGVKLGKRPMFNNPLPFLELRNAGYSIRKIAVMHKCSPATVQRVLKGASMKDVIETK